MLGGGKGLRMGGGRREWDVDGWWDEGMGCGWLLGGGL